MSDHDLGTTPAGDGPRTRRSATLHGILIAAVALSLYLVGNGSVGLWDRDEPRYAVAVREMRQRGDWITPTFNGEPRYHKPILIYWVMGLGTALLGDSPFGARFGSALAGTATCLLAWRLGRSMLGPTAGLVGALALATAPLMIVGSKLATTDATLTMFVVSAQACLWRLHRRADLSAALGFWAALGLAFLTKGPVGPAFIAASAAATWWLGGGLFPWSRMHGRLGLVLFAAIVLPWYVAIGISSGGDFYRYALGVQMIQRVTTSLEHHGGFPGYYLVGTLLAFYPWSALVPAAAVGAWARRKVAPELAFLLGWALGPLVVLEIVKTKLIHYYLPSIPALALLVGRLIQGLRGEAGNLRRFAWARLGLGMLGGLGMLLSACLVVAGVALPMPHRGPCLVLAGVAGVGTVVAAGRLRSGRPVAAAMTLVACWGSFGVIVSGWLLPTAEPYRLSRVVGERLARLAIAEQAAPVLVTFQEPGTIYALRRTALLMRTWNDLAGTLKAAGTIVSAVTPDHVLALRWDGRFRLDVLEELDGFNLNKGKNEPLRFVRVRLNDAASAARPGEQPLVK